MKINHDYFESERVKIVYIYNRIFDKVASVLYTRRYRDFKYFYIITEEIIVDLTRNLEDLD